MFISLVVIAQFLMNNTRKQADYAWWEIGHGKFHFNHPWKKYLEIGNCTRQCAYHIEALNGYLEAKLEVYTSFMKKRLKSVFTTLLSIIIYMNFVVI